MFSKTFCLLLFSYLAWGREEEETLNEKIAGWIDESLHSLCIPQITPDMILPVTPNTPSDLVGVVISTSKYFQNYRHQANALAVYRLMKQLGVSDRNLYLFMGECVTCDPRNPIPGRHFIEPRHNIDLAEGFQRVPFKNQLASSRSWKLLITGRFMTPFHTIRSRYLPDRHPQRDIVVYISGHGGAEFTKFKDYDELTLIEIDRALAEMKLKGGFRRLLILIDSCQAYSLGQRLETPDSFIIASSALGYNAYSCHHDPQIGNTLSDEFTYSTFKLLRKRPKNTLGSWLDHIERDPRVSSKAQASRSLNLTDPVTDWLGSPRFRHIIDPSRKKHSNSKLAEASSKLEKLLLWGPHTESRVKE